MKNSIPIFLASDDNYVPYMATTIVSVAYNTKSKINFYILDGGITKFNKKRIENLKTKFKNIDNIEFIEIDLSKEFKDFIAHGHFTLSTYSRLLIPDLKPNIDKAIYLDSDIVVLGDIAKLYNENLENNIIGAVFDMGFQEWYKNGLEISKKHKYFNSGVLLINSRKWREQNITKKLFEIEEKYREKIKWVDQDILNKCFENNHKQLDMKYNILSSSIKKDVKKKYNITDEYIRQQQKDIVIRHFTGIKPWKTNSELINQNFNDFWFFAEMTPFYAGMQQNFTTIQVKMVEEKIDFIYNAVGVIFFIILISLLSKYIKYIKKKN
jgi:lipopolysaccharide biosynthesis glycosyltransferase